MVPASTVKSSAATMTGRPSMEPEPMTTASAGASVPPTRVPISWKDRGSSRWSIRARTSSFPCPWCLRRRSSPPIAREAVRQPSSSSSALFQAVGAVVAHRTPYRPEKLGGRRST